MAGDSLWLVAWLSRKEGFEDRTVTIVDLIQKSKAEYLSSPLASFSETRCRHGHWGDLSGQLYLAGFISCINVHPATLLKRLVL